MDMIESAYRRSFDRDLTPAQIAKQFALVRRFCVTYIFEIQKSWPTHNTLSSNQLTRKTVCVCVWKCVNRGTFRDVCSAILITPCVKGGRISIAITITLRITNRLRSEPTHLSTSL